MSSVFGLISSFISFEITRTKIVSKYGQYYRHFLEGTVKNSLKYFKNYPLFEYISFIFSLENLISSVMHVTFSCAVQLVVTAACHLFTKLQAVQFGTEPTHIV